MRKIPENVWILCPDTNAPIGGTKILYRHVDALNRLGFSAKIVHAKKNFRLSWFANETPVAHLSDIEIDTRSVWVIPEIFGADISDTLSITYRNRLNRKTITRLDLKGVPKVIFNQNTYYTFSEFGAFTDQIQDPYRSSEVLGALVVSDDNREHLSFLYPGLKVHRIVNSVDSDRFRPAALKENVISYMPRKHALEAQQVFHALRQRGALEGFDVRAIEGVPEAEVARRLSLSQFFFSFGYMEGFSLPPAEAMAAGNLVVGYSGSGGREYFKEDFCFPVPNSDIKTFVASALRALNLFRSQPTPFAEMQTQARAHIVSNYNTDAELASIERAWAEILSS